MQVTIKDPNKYTKKEMLTFVQDCTQAISHSGSAASTYENMYRNRGVEILLGEIDNLDILKSYSYNQTLFKYGYCKYLSNLSKRMIKDYKIYEQIK